MNFKHTALAAIAALGIFNAGQASATLTTATFSTTFNTASTFDGTTFASPTGVDVTVQYDSSSPLYGSGVSAGFYAASASFNIAGRGLFAAANPLIFEITDFAYTQFTGGSFIAALVDIGTAGFGGFYQNQTPTINPFSGDPYPTSVAFSNIVVDVAAGPYTIALSSGDVIVVNAPLAAAVPEPATLALLGLAGLGFLRRRKAA